MGFSIPRDENCIVQQLMCEVWEHTNIEAPYIRDMLPHVTLHRPVVGIDEEKMRNLARSCALRVDRNIRVTVSDLSHFGKEYIVLRINTTQSLASLWVNLNDVLSKLAEYEHGEFDGDNTLHITIAKNTTEVFDKVWPKIQEITVPKIIIPVTLIELYRKLTDGGKWEMIEAFPIPSY